MNDSGTHQAQSERGWIHAQALSGLAFATFLVLHLVNTAVGGLGAEAYDGFQRTMRWYYQFPLVEILAVGVSALVHVSAGIVRMRRRRGRGAARAARWLVWHRRSGYFLLLVIVGHVLATRGPSLFLGVDVDFTYLHFSLHTWPAIMFPYYFILFTCGVYHLSQGLTLAVGLLGVRLPLGLGAPRATVAKAFLTIATLAGTVGILAMGGVTADVDQSRFDEYRELYEKYLPFMAPWK